MSIQDTTLLAVLPVRFEITHGNGIWAVTRDYKPFGTYSSESSALEAIEVSVAETATGGGTSQIVSKAA